MEEDIDFLQKSKEHSVQYFEDTLNHILDGVKSLGMEAEKAEDKLKVDSENETLKRTIKRQRDIFATFTIMACPENDYTLLPTAPELEYHFLIRYG